MAVMGLATTRKGQRSAFNEAVRAGARRTAPGTSHPSASGPSETVAGGIGGTGSLRAHPRAAVVCGAVGLGVQPPPCPIPSCGLPPAHLTRAAGNRIPAQSSAPTRTPGRGRVLQKPACHRHGQIRSEEAVARLPGGVRGEIICDLCKNHRRLRDGLSVAR